MKLILTPADDGGVIMPNGAKVRVRHRTNNGQLQVALVDDFGQPHSPIFKSIQDANIWFKQHTNLEFVPMDQKTALN